MVSDGCSEGLEALRLGVGEGEGVVEVEGFIVGEMEEFLEGERFRVGATE
jgi:hypothetical protein